MLANRAKPVHTIRISLREAASDSPGLWGHDRPSSNTLERDKAAPCSLCVQQAAVARPRQALMGAGCFREKFRPCQ